MDSPPESMRDLSILQEIERDPDIKQSSLADRIGVAVGTVNWHIKRLVSKGYVKVKRAERRKLRYIITPEGINLRARLTVDFVETSMRLFRQTRDKALLLIEEAKEGGAEAIRIEGDGDLAEVCRLTCIEQGLPLVEAMAATAKPSKIGIIEIHGQNLKLHLRDGSGETAMAHEAGRVS